MWYELASKLLEKHDHKFAIAISEQIIKSSKGDLNHNDIWNYIKPLLLKLMQAYHDDIWPILGNEIINAGGMQRYRLVQLIERDNEIHKTSPSVISAIPTDDVMTWCEQNPDIGPSFIASSMDIFEVAEEKKIPSKLFVSLLAKYGSDKRVANALVANLGKRSWEGSLVPYLDSDKEALTTLNTHKNVNVRQWVKDYIDYIDRQRESEQVRDEERDIGIY
ncbi:MAG: hypothetical protein B6D77_07380 [gamma proteobacterium symbiont of Ctena orbiculata]|nr:MAG: hypothetical protein B6D77_07380 [gamma proteobacterium symbiont of Ctena orbiculata]